MNNQAGFSRITAKRKILLIGFIAVFCNFLSGQTVIWSEDFEEAGNDTYVSDQATIPGLTNQWEYDKNNNGRLRLQAGAGFYHGGNNAATVDNSTNGDLSNNFLIATIDLGSYVNSPSLLLSFSYMDHGDENHNNDRVWVRRGDNAEGQIWVEVYNLYPEFTTNGIWNEVINRNISSALASQTSASSLIQICFGQRDNYPASSTTDLDGITFDDIQLTHTNDEFIWFEDFTYADGTNTGTGNPPIATWISDGGNRGVTVNGNRLRGRNTTAPNPDRTTWIVDADPIEIGGFSDVQVTMDLVETGGLANTDYILIQYSIDGGAWINFPTNGYIQNDFNFAIASVSGLVGTELRLQITMVTNDDNQIYFVDNINVSGTPTSAGATGDSYYSYQSGNWAEVSTWTHDPGGSTQTATTIPNSGDNVIILNSRTVTLVDDVDTTNLDVTIREGGILDQTTFEFTSGFSALRGSGTFRLASVNFPAVTTNDFVNTDAGTTEYNNAGNFTLPATQATYYHLTINAPGVTASQLSNISLNGDLHVQKGTYQINDNTANRWQLTINGDVNVDNGASLTIGPGNTDSGDISGGTAPFTDYYDRNSHRIVVYGDFTNNGTVRFTNQNYPVYNAFATNGMATVYFMGATDNTLTCNNTTDFYNLVLDKGIDQTFKLTVYSSAYEHFRLFGRNSEGGENGGANPDLRKALWIRTGTLELSGLTVIPTLSEGGTGGNPNSDFYIPANGALVLNGSEVVVLATADDYQEVRAAYNISTGGTGSVNGVNKGVLASSFSIYGKFEVNDGYFSTRECGGLITWNVASGTVLINGGTVDAKQIRSAGGGGGLASYTQTGGTFLLRGRFQRTPSSYTSVSDLVNAPLNTTRATGGLNGTYGTFNLNETANVFNMSGGTIRVFDACGTAGWVFDVNSASGNINVTGGTVEFVPTTGIGGGGDAAIHYIRSNAPFYNMTVNRASSTSTLQVNTYPLNVKNDLSITSGVLTAADFDVTVGGDFYIQNGTTYTPGNNSTVFNGGGSQSFNINTAATLALKKLKVDKPVGTILTLAGTQNIISVEDSLVIFNAELADGGKTIQLVASTTSNPSVIYNSGIHSGAGQIEIADDDPTLITGNGNGVFGNIGLNNSNAVIAPVSLGANTTINGTLTFTLDNKLFNISDNNLTLGALATVVNVDANNFIQTAGNAGDEGLTKVYSALSNSFTFPVGAISTNRPATAAYTPATIAFSSAPASYGSVTVIPVGNEHPVTSSGGNALTYYWKIKSNGITGFAGNVTHSFSYNALDVVGSEVNYCPSVYDPATYTWYRGERADFDGTNDLFGDWITPSVSTDFLDGEYTAGTETAFGIPTIYYSYQTGLWSETETWSLTDHNTLDEPSNPPNQGDVVIIGDNDSIYLSDEGPLLTDTDDPNNNYYRIDEADVQCASLKIEAGSILDIMNNPGSDFGTVVSHENGNGKIRITTRHANQFDTEMTFAFPSGDFSDFNKNLGTTELYTINPEAGTVYWLPNGVVEYGNLIISPLGGSNIIFPNNDLLIYGNLITRGQNSESWFCPNWRLRTYPTAPTVPVSKTITINGDFDIQGGALIWFNRNGTGAQDFVIDGNLIVATDAGIQVYTNGTANSQAISIGGSFINNSLAAGGGINGFRGCDFSQIPLTFYGSGTHYITNDNPADNTYTNIETLTVNKGSSQADSLIVDITGTFITPTNDWLTLKNGTFKYVRDANLDITTTSSFNIPSTTGLYVDAAGRTIRLANASSNTNDVFLSGKLTIIDGTVAIGNTNNNNQDIEYSGGGGSEIDIQGGSLFVNGQIRRNPATTAGVLKYTQSGGALTINGRNTLASNAKLEILNTGSEFNMSAGTITIVRGGGDGTFGDLYLRPASSSITGGEIIFNPSGAGDQDYLLDANVPIWDLTVNGSGGDDANVELLISSLELDGDLLLQTATSFLDANVNFDIDVTLNGDFTNNGSYRNRNNHTYFTGDSQFLLGTSTTSFYDLTVNPITSLSLSRDITVNNDLFLNRGTLICSDYTVNAKGDVANNATYTDNNTGIALNGTSLQYLSGTGTWGQLELNNSNGARIVNDITLKSDFLLTNGVLDINRYLFTLGANSNIVGSGYDNTKMITSDGVYSDVGISKVFNDTDDGTTFTFPLGTSGKYTPAVLTITNIGNTGSFRINNINSNHPGVIDPTNVLDYFWEVASSGIAGFDGSLVLNYLDGDVQVTGTNTEAEYIAASLLLPGTSWTKAATGAATDRVDEGNDLITFNFSGVSSLSGEYTCGIDPALPDNVPEYTSNSDGDWSIPGNWTHTGGDFYPLTSGPNGFIVTIRAEDTITTDANYASAYRTTINGTLSVPSTTFGHNMGSVLGSGTLALQSGTFPAGRYTDFLNCANGSTLEYGGTGTYTLIADLYSSIPYLHFTGTGTRVLPNKDLIICNQLLIDGPTLDNSVNNRMLTIQGTMERYNSGAFLSGSGAGATVSFEGASAQTIGGVMGNFTGTNAFNNLEIDNALGLTINNSGAIEVTRNLFLTDGLITTSSTNTLSITNTSINCVTPTGGDASSYIDGPLTKRINQGDNFDFPIGKGTELGNKINISATQAGTQNWTVEYFTPNATAPNMANPLTYVNNDEYWSVSSSSGNQAVINLDWNSSSDLTPLMTENGLSDMRVARYNVGSSEWEQLASSSAGSNSTGTVSTTSRISIPGTGVSEFTLACVNVVKPRAQLTPSGAICGTAVGIPVSFTYSGAIPFDYTLDYKINGIAQTQLNITAGDVIAGTYTLATPSIGIYELTAFKYNNGTDLGVVDPTTVEVYQLPTTADIGSDGGADDDDISICGASSVANLPGNSPAVGSGLWSVISGSGGSFTTPTVFNTPFNGTNGSTYQLVWEITNGACTSSDFMVVTFPLLAQQPAAFTASTAIVCQSTTGVTYTVPNDPSVTYSWDYSGTGETIIGAGNSVTIDFDATATSGTLSVNATNGCGTSADRSMVITVNPRPTPAFTAEVTSTSIGTTGNVYTTQAGQSNYVWNVSAGGTITAGGTATDNSVTITWTAAGAQTVTVNYDNANGCDGLVAAVSNVTVSNLPIPTLISSDADEIICAGESVTYTAGGGDEYEFLLNGVSVQAQSATNTYTTTTLSDEDTVTVRVVFVPSGAADTSSGIGITVHALPDLTLTVDVSLDSICTGNNTQIEINFTDGTAPYDFTIQRERVVGGVLVNENMSNISADPYTYTPVSAPVWVDLGTMDPDLVYNYSVLTITDDNGCTNTSIGSESVTVFKIPKTGPAYHVEGIWGN